MMVQTGIIGITEKREAYQDGEKRAEETDGFSSDFIGRVVSE
jgi:hypothetical protein